MDSHLWNVLKEEIHEKCVYYEYIEQSADGSLSDYIISVIQMGKAPDQVSDELGALIGPDYDRYLTQWIFARIEELKNQKSSTSTNAPVNTISPPQHQQQQIPTANFEINEKMVTEEEDISPKPPMEKASARKNRMFSQALSGLGQRQQRHQSRDYQDIHRSDQHMTSRDHYDTQPDRRQHQQQRPHPDRRQQHRPDYRRDHTRSRSRSRSPIRHSERTVHREYKDNTIFARLGNSSNGSSPTAEPKTMSVFDRLGIKKPERVETEESEQKRCKYWPTCDKGDDCVFVHPHTLCPDFPNCPKKATECLFIHPYTPKKPSHTATDSSLTEKAIPCRYFPHCNNDQCPYFHPPAIPSFYESPPYPAYQPYQPPAQAAPTIKRIPVPCKNGEHCTRPGCHFLHPKDSNPAEIICKFDGACTRPGCFYKHTAQSGPGFGTSYNKSLVVNQSSTTVPAAPTKSQRGFAIADDSQVEKMQVGESADLIKPEQQQQDTDMDL